MGAQIILVSTLAIAAPVATPAAALCAAALRRHFRCFWPRAALQAVTQREFTRAWMAVEPNFGLAERCREGKGVYGKVRTEG